MITVRKDNGLFQGGLSLFRWSGSARQVAKCLGASALAYDHERRAQSAEKDAESMASQNRSIEIPITPQVQLCGVTGSMLPWKTKSCIDNENDYHIQLIKRVQL